MILINFLWLFLKFKSNFFSGIPLNGCLNTLCIFVTMMLSLQTLNKYDLLKLFTVTLNCD